MNAIRRLGFVVAVLMFVGVASAEYVVTVQDVVDYTDNLWDEDLGVWFLVPREVYEDPCNWYEDHMPWHRGSNQDWGWSHDVSTRVPLDATGIESATLTIMAWDVDSDEGEDDVILANDRYLGMLTGIDRDWKPVTFTLPAPVIDELWANKTLDVFMDIDQMVDLSGGYRVTLKNSTLTIKYITSGTAPTTIPVFRFWSPVFGSHFYTVSESERDVLIVDYPYMWTFEGTAYQTLADAGGTQARPVYRFWSQPLAAHFFTIDETERQWLIDNYSDVWTDEGVAFYAFASGAQPAGTLPVYRFWSPVLGNHFYTVDEVEKQTLIDLYSDVWTYEGIAWYAFAP